MNNQEFRPELDEARWQAQERARVAASPGGRGVGCIDADADDVRIARALRSAPAVDLPADFALRVARLARGQQASTTLLEQRLLRGLTLVLGLSSAASVAYYGHAWAAALASALPGGNDALGWSAAAALCVVANWAWGLVRDRLQGGHDVLA